MRVVKCETKQELGRAAAADGAALIREAIRRQNEAVIVVATGMSQFEMLSELVREGGIDWGAVTGFHLDEYVGLPMTHPASFRAYLRDRFVSRLPKSLRAFHYINGEGNCEQECARLNGLIRRCSVDAAFIGIGENGHLAFNDPPADFETEEPYIIVNLDEKCRQQQVGEGWFSGLEDVPAQAISMSIRQIMKARGIICSVPDERKAAAVKGAVEGPVTPQIPASILQAHSAVTLYLDPGSASLLA